MPVTSQAWAVSDYGPAETLRPVEIALAEPGAGGLLVRVEAMSLNPLDLKIMSGQMRDFMPVAMPFVPGSDLVGVVTDAGANAPASVGDRVVVGMWSGALAHHAAVPASAHVVATPHSGPAADLAALPMAALTANFILRDLGSVQRRTMAIIGATGGVGLALVQLASAAGATVYASSGSDEDAALVQSNGAAEAICHRDGAFVARLLGRVPGGADIVVDLVTMFDRLSISASGVRDGGVLLSTLFGPDPSTFADRITMRYIRLKPWPADLDAVVRRYEAGLLRANVSRTFSFDQGRQAYLALRDEHVRGKIAVIVE